MRRITLLTDFGSRDGYLGAMKGVMATILPGVAIDDVSHDIEPGDVAGAAMSLARYWDRYPAGTVHLVVVDPGVGTDRRALAADAERRLFVAPDNGVLSRVHDVAKEMRFVEIDASKHSLPDMSATFHGRDLFAPVAAHLARGVHLSLLGSALDDPVRVDEPPVVSEDKGLLGQVVARDRFGNLVTNLPGDSLGKSSAVEIGGQSIGTARTYGEVPPDRVAALINSDGRVEVAARDSSAAAILQADVGTPVRILQP